MSLRKSSGKPPFILSQLAPLVVFALAISSLGSCPLQAQEQSTDYVPKEAFGALLVNFEAFKDSPDMEYFPHEIVTALGKQNYGFDPAEIDSVKMIFALGQKGFASEPSVGVILELKKEQKLADRFEEMGPATDVDGTEIYFDENLNMYMVQAKPKVVLFASSEPFAVLMAASRNVKNPFTKLLAKSKPKKMFQMVLSVEQLKPVLDELLDQYPAPPPFGVVNTLHERIQSIDMQTTLLGGIDMALQIVAYDDGDARKVEKAIKQLLSIAKASALTFMAAQTDSEDIIQQAQYDYAVRISDKLERELTPTRKGKTLTIEFKNEVANVGVLVALLLPAVQSAREAARRTQSTNNIRQFSLSFHNYNEVKGRFPAQAITDKKGKKLLSWRVEVLPYLGHQALYDQFRLDEPWDSDHNIKLLDRMPPIFRNPNLPESTETNFLAVTGKGTAFDGDSGRKLSEFKDGLSNSIIFVESNKTVPWTKPEDFEVDWREPANGLGGIRPGIFVAGFADGSVQSISSSIDMESLENLFKIDNGK